MSQWPGMQPRLALPRVALAARLAALPQASAQRAALGADLANPLVEQREADRDRPGPFQATRHLLGLH